MRILITGGTGFIGAQLCHHLVAAGHQLTVYSRHPEKISARCGDKVAALDSLELLTSASEFDAVINLAGESIAGKRWSARRKQVLLESRLVTTRKLVAAFQRMAKPPACLINASAVGFYGDQGDVDVDENTLPKDDFGHQLCQQWESAARQAEALGVRVCIARIGLVVGKGGGFLEKVLLPFKLGMGGRFGSGEQWMSWIHRDDLVRLIDWLLDHSDCHGVYNATSPYPVTNERFTKTLAGLLKRPTLLPMPAMVVQLMFGEMAQLLLTGQRVLPCRLLEGGFEFSHPDLKSALEEALT
ncbi:MAG: TIGR01777 family oxidoreductase [Pseudomonadales bacterium]